MVQLFVVCVCLQTEGGYWLLFSFSQVPHFSMHRSKQTAQKRRSRLDGKGGSAGAEALTWRVEKRASRNTGSCLTAWPKKRVYKTRGSSSTFFRECVCDDEISTKNWAVHNRDHSDLFRATPPARQPSGCRGSSGTRLASRLKRSQACINDKPNHFWT